MQIVNNIEVDIKSIGGIFITGIGSILTSITKNDILLWMTVTAAFTTVVYNLIQIYKSFKSKK